MKRALTSAVLFALAASASAIPPPLPHIKSVVPNSGGIAGGDVVTIVFDNLNGWQHDRMAVRFDGVTAPSVTEIAENTLRVVTPKHRRGNVDVTAEVQIQLFATGGEQAFTYTSDEPIVLSDYEPVLLPVVVWPIGGSVVGADGARWATDVTLSNSGNTDVEVVFGDPPRIRVIHAHQWMRLWRDDDTRGAGAIVYVQRRGAERVALSLHVVSLFEYIDSEVPPVRERELRDGPIDLPGVRIGPRSRGTLRVYDVNATPGAAVDVKVYLSDGELVGSAKLPLSSAGPGYAAYGSMDVTNLGLLPGGTYRIVIEPSSAQMRLWAFVASADNGGGHIRTTTPH